MVTKIRADQVNGFVDDGEGNLVLDKNLKVAGLSSTAALSVANGGTGLSSLAAGRIPYGAVTSALASNENLKLHTVII